MRRKVFTKWELRACARRGHVTFKPTGPLATNLIPRLSTQTKLGEAWRCLRCGVFVLGKPRYTRSPTQAPRVLRGKALRQAFILRLLAAERAIRAIGIFLLAYGVFEFHANQTNLQHLFAQQLPAFEGAASYFHYDFDSSGLVSLISSSLNLKGSTLELITIGLIAYGGVEAIEAIGLWLLKRWGEYFAVIATSCGIPFEIYELIDHATWLKAAALALNVLAVVYLLLSKRLFGLRGGREAYEHQLQGESMIEVELAASRPEAAN